MLFRENFGKRCMVSELRQPQGTSARVDTQARALEFAVAGFLMRTKRTVESGPFTPSRYPNSRPLRAVKGPSSNIVGPWGPGCHTLACSREVIWTVKSSRVI